MVTDTGVPPLTESTPPPLDLPPPPTTPDSETSISLFPTTAHWSPDGLHVPLKGWCHISHRTSFRRNLILGLGRRLLSPIRSHYTKESDSTFHERAGAFLDSSLTEQGCIRVVVRGLKLKVEEVDRLDWEDERRQMSVVELEGLCDGGVEVWPLLDKSGLFSEEVVIPEEVVRKWIDEAGEGAVIDQLDIVAYKAKGDQAGTNDYTTCTIVSSDGISIITDLDDTIKHSDVFKGATSALNNAFFVPTSTPIAGMSELYQMFYNNSKAAFHYVSASPFQLADPIDSFLIENGFPAGSVVLRDVWVQRSRREYKDAVAKELFTKYPNRKFILIGDAGEKDAEIYAKIFTDYPGRVVKILIRDVSDGKDEAKLKIVRDALVAIPEDIHAVFTDPTTLHELTLSF
ncbi:hypothetical protein HDU98_009846 [Podochytrium sp. JEL0797]|nr:hypothetical protein HDU98_009846 [Podochytrium sp. JEL0797]